jgi:hypothetical protein
MVIMWMRLVTTEVKVHELESDGGGATTMTSASSAREPAQKTRWSLRQHRMRVFDQSDRRRKLWILKCRVSPDIVFACVRCTGRPNTSPRPGRCHGSDCSLQSEQPSA